MEKNGVVAIGASKAVGEEAPIPVPASTVAAGEEAPTGLGQIPLGWDPYKEVDYIRPKNPYDTSIADPWSEEDRSDVRSDDESKDTNTRHVLRRLKSGQYNNFLADDVYMCPFCPTRRLRAIDFNFLVKHAKDVRTCGESVNVHGFIDKHQALGLHLHNLQKVAIEEVRMPPIKPKGAQGQGTRQQEVDEAKALLAEAMRVH